MRFCGRCGTPLIQASLGRERRYVSVVFIDLSGFTKLTHGFDPEQLRDLADEILTVVAGIIEDYDGYVDAFQGDGLIALFGAPHSHPDDPQRAVEASAASLRAIESIGESKGFALKGRAGVNTGTVIAGSVGSGRVREYTVMGSAVNLAARLETAAAPGEVWVGPETFEATRHHSTYQKVSGIRLAGFPNITEAFKLESLKTVGDDPYAELDFVGREREKELLHSTFREVIQTQQSRTLWLVGEAGSGKTRLAREFLKDIRQTAHRTLWINEQSLGSRSMWQQLARQMVTDSSQDAAIWAKQMRQRLNELLPGEPRWQTYILNSLGLITGKPWRRLERRSIDRTFLAWRDLLLAFVRENEHGGTVMIVEHSSQGSSFSQFLDLLVNSDGPLFLVRTNRGKDRPHQADALFLRPLSLTESLTLVDQIANPILRVATESLVFQVGGIPANILELGRALSITPKGSFSGSLASLLQARLDMLSPEARRLLAVAALNGEKCWESLMFTLANAHNSDALTELLEDNLLLKEATSSIVGETEYRFQSELLRRAVLRMIPFSDRPLLHLRAATWLEKEAPLDLSALIGHHFKEGRSPEAAYPHYLAAADLALNEQDSDKAFGYYKTLTSLELPHHLLAEGCLAFAQAALSYCHNDLALKQLTAADAWIELSDEAHQENLRSVYSKLYADLKPE